jgi:hypothetical protein
MEKEEEEKKEKGRIWNKKCSHVRESLLDRHVHERFTGSRAREKRRRHRRK